MCLKVPHNFPHSCFFSIIVVCVCVCVRVLVAFNRTGLTLAEDNQIWESWNMEVLLILISNVVSRTIYGVSQVMSSVSKVIDARSWKEGWEDSIC